MGRAELSHARGEPSTAVVLVGGFGTRLRPLTYEVPKQLVPLAGRAALYHVFDLVPEGIARIVLACGYKADEIEKFLHDNPYPIPVTLVREETPLGTGGGLKNVERQIPGPFLLFNGDAISGVDIPAMIRAQGDHGALGTMSLFEVEDTKPYGVAALAPDDRIVRFVEKPAPEAAPSHWINAGVSVWAREVLDRIPPGRPVSFEQETMPLLLAGAPRAGPAARGIYGFKFDTWWEDAGTLDRMLNAQHLLFDHPEHRRVLWRTPATGGVVPPVAMGERCRVEGARVGRYVTLGDRVTLEEGSVVEDSIVMDGAVVGKGATIRHSIVGPSYGIPPGASVVDRILAEPARR